MRVLRGPLAGRNVDAPGVGRSLEVLDTLFREREDGAGLYEPGVLANVVAEVLDGAALEELMVRHIVPVASGRQPDTARCKAVFLQRLANRGGQDVVTEEVFLFPRISFGLLRVLVIERAAERDARLIGLAGHIVDIGREGVAKFQRLLHVLVMIGEHPDAAFDDVRRGAVGLEDGREYAVLQPACEEFRIGGFVLALHVAAQVVAPVTVQHIRSRGGEFRQIAEHLPFDVSIAGKAQLIAVAAQTAPAVVNHRTDSFFGRLAAVHPDFVVEKDMVEPEGVAQARHIAALFVLLPVEPPEIHALPLQRMNHAVEIGIRPGTLVEAVRYSGVIARLGGSAINRLATLVDKTLRSVVIICTGDIVSHKSRIHFFPRYDADGRMQVEGGL